MSATEAHRDPAIARDPLCFRSREDLFEWDHEAVAHVKGEMLAGGCSAAELAGRGSTVRIAKLTLQH